MQCTQYDAFLNGHKSATGPSKDELLLKFAKEFGNISSIIKTMNNMLGASKLCLQVPHLEGERIFGFAKHKLDLPP